MTKKKHPFLALLRTNWWIVLILSLMAFSCLLPIINTVAISFSDQAKAAAGSVGLWPVGFTLSSYEKLFAESTFAHAFGVSLLRVVLGIGIGLSITILMAYPLSKTNRAFPGRNFYMWLLVFTMIFNAGIIPWYMMIRSLRLLNTIWALVLPCAVSSYNIILMMNFFKGIPREIEEAAIVDGSGAWRTLIQLYLPLSMPSLATITLFILVYHWNNFYDGLILLSKPSQYPLQTYIYQLTVKIDPSTISDAESLKAALKVSGLTLNASKLVISMVPVMLVYPFLQRYFVKGLTLGAVKG